MRPQLGQHPRHRRRISGTNEEADAATLGDGLE
jgi:hypothetical protein